LEATQMCEIGVDHIGVLVGDGAFPREIAARQAREILNAVVDPARRIALTLSNDRDAIEQIADALQPDILHLGSLLTDIGVDDVLELKRLFPQIRIMRSIPVTGPESISASKQFASAADYLLLDSYKTSDQQIGATGVIHDWAISRKIVESVSIPVILAGGLGPENVGYAIRAVHPAGVDSKTRTDLEGSHRKDLNKVKRFVQLAKETAAMNTCLS